MLLVVLGDMPGISSNLKYTKIILGFASLKEGRQRVVGFMWSGSEQTGLNIKMEL